MLGKTASSPLSESPRQVPFYRPYFTGREIEALASLCASGEIATDGHYSRRCIRQLENKLKSREVLIMWRKCAMLRPKDEKPPFKVTIDPQKCIGEACGCNRICTRVFKCPGLAWDAKAEKSKIDEVICNGCGVCTDICPAGAIQKEAQ